MATKKRTRRKFDTAFKASVLAELSQQSLASVAKQHELSESLIHRWKAQAGMGSKGEASMTRSGYASQRKPPGTDAALQAVSDYMALNGKRRGAYRVIAKKFGLKLNTLQGWGFRYGLPAPSSAANSNGAPINGAAPVSEPAAPVESATMISSSAFGDPIAQMKNARDIIAVTLAQMDRAIEAFGAFQAVFGSAFRGGHHGQAARS